MGGCGVSRAFGCRPRNERRTLVGSQTDTALALSVSLPLSYTLSPGVRQGISGPEKVDSYRKGKGRKGSRD